MATRHPSPPRKPRLRTTEQASAFYDGRVSSSWLEKARMGGYGPRYLKLGVGRNAKVFYTEDDLSAWLETCRRETQS